MRTIDCTPTWEGLTPLMLEIIKQNKKGVEDMRKEFMRMAQAADKWNAHVKEELAKKG